jgi:hypothetical protein
MAYWIGITEGEDLNVSSQELLDKAVYGLTNLGFLPISSPSDLNPFESFTPEKGETLRELYSDLGLHIVCIEAIISVESLGKVI